MTPGIVAFFVVLWVLTAAYALFAKTGAPAETAEAAQVTQPTSGDAKRTGETFEKLVRPVLSNLIPQTPRALREFARKSDAVSALLARTGNPWRVSPEEYVVVRVLAIVVGAMGMMMLAVLNYAPIPLIAAVPAGMFIGYMGPKAMLDSAWGARRRDLVTTLPEALDLLRICMNAGFNFQNALQETVRLMAPSVTRDELSRVAAELQSGRTVTVALDAFARRCPTESVEAFVRAISQAQSTGVDIATTLAYQSTESRAEYEREVDVRAQKLQTMLFLPLIGFFLPTLLILLFGPSAIQLLGVL